MISDSRVVGKFDRVRLRYGEGGKDLGESGTGVVENLPPSLTREEAFINNTSVGRPCFQPFIIISNMSNHIQLNEITSSRLQPRSPINCTLVGFSAY